MKGILLIFGLFLFGLKCMSQITGLVKSAETNEPISQASLRLIVSNLSAQTDLRGQFVLQARNFPDTLLVSSLGYHPERIPISQKQQSFSIYLRSDTKEIEAVIVKTGYQDIRKQQAVGSFSHMDNEMINRSMSPDIISRMEGMVAGLQFDRSVSSDAPASKPDLRVRGLSTIHGETYPLIILDNFPFEGNLNDINPNDIESITVLKDASASSIWGARAGNGVIVITSKKGQVSPKLNIGVNINATTSSRPDLFYDRRFIPASEAIELEKMLFEKGLYQKNDWTAYTPVVETLFALEEGRLDSATANSRIESFTEYDIRAEATEHLYRPLSYRQYALNASGGSEGHRYYLSMGVDKNDELVVGNDNRRITVLARNELDLGSKFTLSNTVSFVENSAAQNGIGLLELAPTGMSNNPYVYMRLTDDSGDPISVVRNNRKAYTEQAVQVGLLDWEYRPLDELKLADNTSKRKEVRFNAALTYRITDFLSVEGRYQVQNAETTGRRHYAQDTYFARHMINCFTQSDGTRPVPVGGILDRSSSSFLSNYGRLQANLDRDMGDHHVSGIIGAEIRQERNISHGNSRLYGYSDELLTSISTLDFTKAYPLRPNQSGRIENGNTPGQQITDRFVSYYANISYSFKDRYLSHTSIRWDASNIYGVEFNQKGTPLWSLGVGWNPLKEPGADQLLPWFSDMKLRATYGLNGNSFRTLSSLPTVRYGAVNGITGQPQANLISVGNPDLSWEKVETINIGLDFNMVNQVLGGSVERYIKNSSNLIGEDLLDPTKGIYSTGGTGFNVDSRRNYADLQTTGWDVILSIRPIRGKATWQSHILFSTVENRVTNYYTKTNMPILSYLTGIPPVVEGNSKDQLYAVPWHGLDREGNPLVMVDGILGTDYNAYFNNLTYDGYSKIGVRIAPYFGAFRNSFEWNGLKIDANITWKAGHVFKRSTVEYSNLLGPARLNNIDYLSRWQGEGDEHKTVVPSMPSQANSYRDAAYASSEVIFENASHIRLQDIGVSYTIPKALAGRWGISKANVHLYAKNLGLIWKRTTFDLDPDVFSLYPQPKQLSVGFNLIF